MEEVIRLYQAGIDRTLLEKNLTLTPQQRIEQLQELLRFAEELRRAGKQANKR